MILTDAWLLSWATHMGGLSDLDSECINPASIDLKLSNQWRDLYYPHTLRVSNRYKVYAPSSVYEFLYAKWAGLNKILRLPPPEHRPSAILASTKEIVSMNNIHAGEVKLKTTPTRKGLGYLAADWVDPGFTGQLTLTIYVQRDMELWEGQRICQLVVYQLDHPVVDTYDTKGHYMNQYGPTLAWDVNNESI